MDFLYPKFDKPTHKTKEIKSISREYPSNIGFSSRLDLAIAAGTVVTVIQENIGYNFSWARVIVVGQDNTQESFYTTQDNLESIGNKATFIPINTLENTAKVTLPELDPNLKEVFIPYIDERNGFYSVRIQTDYQKVLDSLIFENLLHDVFYEGVSLLLASRGYKSDNAYIDNLILKYYTFAYVNNDLDLTVNRYCEPLTFTVSIPLSFFNEKFVDVGQLGSQKSAPITLSFTNSNIKTNINKIINIWQSRAGDILNLTYPNKFIESFIVDFEINSMRSFALAANEIFSLAGAPFNAQESIDYEIGLDNDLDIVYIKFENSEGETYLNEAFLARSRLKNEFNSKRIFNYLLNLDGMLNEIRLADMKQFIFKYVKYPNPQILTDTVKINGREIPSEKIAEFKAEFDKGAEECVSLNDLSKLTVGGAQAANIYNTLNLSDPLYHIFIKKDVKGFEEYNAMQALKEKGENFNEQIKSVSSKDINPTKPFGLSAIRSGLSNGVSDAIQNIEEKRANLNTLIYFLNRININQTLFKKIFCLLKGANVNDPEIAKIISDLPVEILTYFNYMKTISGLQGADYIRALALGTVPDIKLFCSKNSGLIYFIKGLSGLVKVLNSTGNILLKIQTSVGTRTQIQNPWAVFSRTVVNSLEQTLIQVLLDTVSDLLSTSCEDNLINSNTTDYRDPYSTHTPMGRFGEEENNNKDALNKNRSDVLNKIYDNELQFGFDREYAVDLIGQLLSDINCILTPTESVNLLLGTPDDVSKTLIKNIIRTKYSAPPNDLSFFLTDENKLKMFFKELGLTVDQEYLIEIKQVVENYLEPAQICDDQVLKARTSFLENKIPKELGILERRLTRRKKEAKRLFEKIKNGETSVDISPLCPEISNSDLEAANNSILQEYADTISRIFSPVLTNFTSEAKNIPETFSEDRITSVDENYKNYKTYKHDLSINLKEALYEIKKDSINDKYTYSYGFFNKTNISDLKKAQTQTTPPEEPISVFCPIDQFVLSQEFTDFVNDGRLIFEFAASYNLDEDNIGNYKGDDRNTYVGDYLNGKDYFAVIILNRDGDAFGLDYDEVKTYLYFNQDDTFKIVDRTYNEGPFGTGYDTDSLVDDVVNNFESVDTRYGYNILDDGEDIFTPSSIEAFNTLPDRTKQFIQNLFLTRHKEKIKSLKQFQSTEDLMNKMNNKGLFKLETEINKKKGQITKTLFLTEGKGGDITKDKQGINTITFEDIEYLPFTINEQIVGSIDNEKLEKFLQDLRLVPSFLLGESQGLEQEMTDLLSKNIFLKDAATAADKSWPNTGNTLIDETAAAYADLTKLDYFLTKKFKKCNVYPHYLNLDYILKTAINAKKQDLCEIEKYDPADILTIAIVELTVRTYITDFLIKSIPYISRMTLDSQKKFYENKTYLKILQGFLKKEFEVFSETDFPNAYYSAFVKAIKSVYKLYENNGLLKPKFIDGSEDKEIIYFIKKEIYRFFKYAIEKKMFPSAKFGFAEFFSFFATSGVEAVKKQLEEKKAELARQLAAPPDEDGNKLYDVSLPPEIDRLQEILDNYNTFYLPNLEAFTQIINLDYDFFLAYFLMADTVDYKKRVAFYNVKSELSQIFFSNIKNIKKVADLSEEDDKFTNRRVEEVVKFINNLTYSPSPAILLKAEPQYSKYIKYAMEASLNLMRTTLSTMAEASDPNISLTKKLNLLATTALSIPFGLLDAKAKNNLIINDPTLTVKRISDGRSFVLDAGLSLPMIYFLPLTPVGISYLLVDTVQETLYYINALEEVSKMTGQDELKTEDPCEVPASVTNNTVNNDVEMCTADSQKKLIQEIDSMEDV